MFERALLEINLQIFFPLCTCSESLLRETFEKLLKNTSALCFLRRVVLDRKNSSGNVDFGKPEFSAFYVTRKFHISDEYLKCRTLREQYQLKNLSIGAKLEKTEKFSCCGLATFCMLPLSKLEDNN